MLPRLHGAWNFISGQLQPINHTSTAEDVVGTHTTMPAPIGHTQTELTRPSIVEPAPSHASIVETHPRRRKSAVHKDKGHSSKNGRGAEKPPPVKRKSGFRRQPTQPFACHFFQRCPEAWSHNASCAKSYSDVNKLKYVFRILHSPASTKLRPGST